MSARRHQETPMRSWSLPAIESVELSSFNEPDSDNDNSFSALSRPTDYAWYPKLTLYRLLIIVATVGLGAAKAVTSYLNLNYASITLEWVFGVVVCLFFHFTGSYEEQDTRRLNWLFHVDYLEYIWNLLAIFEIYRPFYLSDEIYEQNERPRHPMLTGYRILVTILVLFFGFLKAAFGYVNQQNNVTTVECVFGVGIVTYLYWLGLYEASSTKKYPALFHVDYSYQVQYGLSIGALFGKIAIYLIALTISSGMSVGFYYLVSMLSDFRWSASMAPQFPIVSISTSLVIEGLAMLIFLSAVGTCLMIIYKLFELIALSRLGQDIARQRGPREAMRFVHYLHQDYLLPRTVQRRGSRGFHTTRFIVRQIIKLPIVILTTYIVLLFTVIVLWEAVCLASTAATSLQSLSLSASVTFPLICLLLLSPVLWVFSLVASDFYNGFISFLSGIRKDYIKEFPS